MMESIGQLMATVLRELGLERTPTRWSGCGSRWPGIACNPRARRASNRLSRSGADAPRLHPRLRPAAAIAAPCGKGGLGRELIIQGTSADVRFGLCDR